MTTALPAHNRRGRPRWTELWGWVLLGIHRLVSQGPTPSNLLGNASATVVMAKWEGARDGERLHRVLDEEPAPEV